MLKYGTKTIANRVAINYNGYRYIEFNDGVKRNNYADVYIKFKPASYFSLELDLSGTFNYVNSVGISKFIISRINNFSKAECVYSTFPTNVLFITPTKIIDSETVVFRIWSAYENNSIDFTPLSYRAHFKFFNDYRGDTPMPCYVSDIKVGYEKPILHIEPMVTGDCVEVCATNDDSLLSEESSYVKSDDVIKVTFPTSNDKYRKITKIDLYSYIEETQDTMIQQFYVPNLKAGLNKIVFPKPWPSLSSSVDNGSYNIVVNPILGPLGANNNSFTTVNVVGGAEYRNRDFFHVKCSVDTHLDVISIGNYKNPRFKLAGAIYFVDNVTANDKKNSKSFYKYFTYFKHINNIFLYKLYKFNKGGELYAEKS